MDLHWMCVLCFLYLIPALQNNKRHTKNGHVLSLMIPHWNATKWVQDQKDGGVREKRSVCQASLGVLVLYVCFWMDLVTQKAALSMSYWTSWKLSTESHLKHSSRMPAQNFSPQCLQQVNRNFHSLLVSAAKNMQRVFILTLPGVTPSFKLWVCLWVKERWKEEEAKHF